MHTGPSQAGFTLIEAVIAIVVLSIGAVSILAIILTNIRASGDPMLQEQANAIAQSYMEEVMLASFCDPNDFSTDCPSDCSSAACSNCSGSTVSGGGAETRASFDDICDYDGLTDSAGAVDKTGSLISGLTDYNVAVSVDDGAVINGTSGASGRALSITVSVTHDAAPTVNVRLQSFRTNF